MTQFFKETLNPVEDSGDSSVNESVEKEPEVEAAEGDDEREKTKELLELASLARREAESILKGAYGISGQEGIEMEKEAYRIYAALMELEIELPENIIDTTKGLIEKGKIAGFSSKNSAEVFLREVVGNIKNAEETVAA